MGCSLFLYSSKILVILLKNTFEKNLLNPDNSLSHDHASIFEQLKINDIDILS